MTDPNMPGVVTTLGPIKEDTKKVAYEVVKAAKNAGYPIYFVWGIGSTGDHKKGMALDFMVYDKGTVAHPGPIRKSVGDWIANYLWTHRKRLGVRYTIYNRRIRSVTGTPPNVWLKYSGSDPHTNHVHMSRIANPPKYSPPPTAKIVYTVKAGDSLGSISMKYYHTATKWKKIYDANVKVIGSNPNVIKAGQKLVIPK